MDSVQRVKGKAKATEAMSEPEITIEQQIDAIRHAIDMLDSEWGPPAAEGSSIGDSVLAIQYRATHAGMLAAIATLQKQLKCKFCGEGFDEFAVYAMGALMIADDGTAYHAPCVGEDNDEVLEGKRK